MTTNHVFNEAQKRFEPSEKKCQYCKVNQVNNMEDNYFVPLFTEGNRTNLIVYSSVRFQKVQVGIPRCRECSDIYELMRNTTRAYLWGGGCLILVILICLFGVFGILGIFPIVFIGIMGSGVVEDKLVQKKGILTKLEGAKKDAMVQDLVIRGWTFTQPNP